jgi:hypothetical protein
MQALDRGGQTSIDRFPEVREAPTTKADGETAVGTDAPE